MKSLTRDLIGAIVTKLGNPEYVEFFDVLKKALGRDLKLVIGLTFAKLLGFK